MKSGEVCSRASSRFGWALVCCSLINVYVNKCLNLINLS